MKIKKGFKLRSVGGVYAVTGEGLEQIDFNKLVSLNSSAAYLWQEVETKEFNVKELSALLVSKYGIDQEQAMKDASELIEKWTEAGLVEE